MDSIDSVAKQIEMVIFDIDGVLTDGSLFIGDDGQEYKAFNSKDGHGIRMLQDCGVKVAILTGRKSQVVLHRAKDLGITLVMQGYRDKRPAFQDLLRQTGLRPEQVCYMGDDVVDLPVMMQVGLRACVADAVPLVKAHSHWVSSLNGGRGAGRELCEYLMQARGMLNEKLQSYLQP